MYTLEKINTSPLCILDTLMPQIVPLLTLTLLHTWYEESTPWASSCQPSWRLKLYLLCGMDPDA